MEIKLKTFQSEPEGKRVGFEVRENGRLFVIDKVLSPVEGKTEQEYMADAYVAAKPEIDSWLAEIAMLGKQFDPESGTLISPPENISLTFEQQKTLLQKKVWAHMDEKAAERNYDGILSLCTYATSSNPQFQAEGQAGVEWRDAVCVKCYEILSQVEAESRPVPTEAELLAELPAFTWPTSIA